MTALVQSIVDDMADAGMTITCRRPNPSSYVCPAVALKRAIRNLLDNAVKYGRRGPLRSREVRKTIDILVDDEGRGIPEPELSRVTEPILPVGNLLAAGRRAELASVWR